MKKVKCFVFVILATLFFAVSFLHAEETFTVSHPEFTTPSGAKLKTTLLVPKQKPPKDGFPVILLEGPDKIFASMGYVTLEYHELVQRLRVGVASDEELKKVVLEDMLNYIKQNAPANMKKIAVLGGSGGGVMALRLTGLDQRFAASVPMAAPYNFEDAVIPNGSVRFASALFAVVMLSSFTGQNPAWLTPQEKQEKTALIPMIALGVLQGTNLKGTINKAVVGYPKPELSTITTPTFINYSWDDLLVPPEDAYTVYEGLKSAKKIILSEGHHGSEMRPEEMGFQLAKKIMWFDHYLKGAQNGIDAEPKFIAALPKSENPNRKGEFLHIYFSDFPPKETHIETFYLHEGRVMDANKPEKDEADVTIENAMQASGFEDPIITRLIEMVPQLISMFTASAQKTGAEKGKETSQGQNMGGMLDMAGTLITNFFDKVKGLVRPGTIGTYYDRAPLAEDKMFMGMPEVKVFVSSPSKAYQMHFKLYDVDEKGMAKLITRIPYTGKESDVQEVDVKLSPRFYVFKKGHKIRLSITSTDFIYILPVFDANAAYTLHQGTESPSLAIPFIEKSDWDAPQKPENVSAKEKGTRTLVSWKATKDSDVAGYFIYRRDSKIEDWIQEQPGEESEKKDAPDKTGMLGGLDKFVRGMAKLKYADNLRPVAYVPAGKTSYLDVLPWDESEAEKAYAVSALDKAGNEGAVSDAAPVTK